MIYDEDILIAITSAFVHTISTVGNSASEDEAQNCLNEGIKSLYRKLFPEVPE